jgi:hypothetical protein
MTDELKPTRDSGKEEMPRRGPAGDVRPNENDPDPRTRGGQKPEEVEDRPNVGRVKPEDYPQTQLPGLT